MCTDYATCSTSGGRTPIAVAKQKYALSTGTAYASGTALSTTPTKALLTVPKVTDPLNITTKTIWWGIEIPLGTIAGTYSGVNTITSTADGRWSYGGGQN